jgi:hypothetical protein
MARTELQRNLAQNTARKQMLPFSFVLVNGLFLAVPGKTFFHKT